MIATKIKPKDVVKMRTLKDKNPEMPTTKIAKLFRISQAYAYNIIARKYFKNVRRVQGKWQVAA